MGYPKVCKSRKKKGGHPNVSRAKAGEDCICIFIEGTSGREICHMLHVRSTREEPRMHHVEVQTFNCRHMTSRRRTEEERKGQSHLSEQKSCMLATRGKQLEFLVSRKCFRATFLCRRHKENHALCIKHEIIDSETDLRLGSGKIGWTRWP